MHIPFFDFTLLSFALTKNTTALQVRTTASALYRASPVLQRSVLFHNATFEVLSEVHAGLLRCMVRCHLLHVVTYHQLY